MAHEMFELNHLTVEGGGEGWKIPATPMLDKLNIMHCFLTGKNYPPCLYQWGEKSLH